MLIVQPLDASIWGNRNGIYEHLGILLNQINQQYCQQNVCYSLRYRHHAIVTLDGVLTDKHAYQTDLLLHIKFSQIVCTIYLGTRTCDIKNIVQYIIHMDMTVVLGYHKFSLHATIDHHGPSIYSGHYTTSVNCCNRTFYCNDNKITEFDMINTKNSSTAYVVIYKLIT